MPIECFEGNNGGHKIALYIRPEIINDKLFWKSHKNNKSFNAVIFEKFNEPITKIKKLKEFFKRNQILSVEFKSCTNVGSDVFRAFKHLANTLKCLNLTTYVEKFDHIKALKHVPFKNQVKVSVAVNSANLKKLLAKNKQFIICEQTEAMKPNNLTRIPDSVDYRRIKMEREQQLMEQRRMFSQSRQKLNGRDVKHMADSSDDTDEEERQRHRKYVEEIRLNQKHRSRYDLSDTTSSDSSTESDSMSESETEDSDDSNDSDTLDKRYYAQYGRSINKARDLRRK